MTTEQEAGGTTSRRDLPVAIGGLVLAAIIILVGNTNLEPGENGGTGPAIVTSVICLVLAAALFVFVVPRARNTDRTALILGGAALLTIVVFWSGVTPVLAAAAVAVARRAPAPGRAAVAGQILGALGTLVALVVTIFG
jgi:hypothetical protein